MLGRHRFGMFLRLLAVDIQPQHATLQGSAGSGQIGVFRLDRMNAGWSLLRGGLILMRAGVGRLAVVGSGLGADFGEVAGHRGTSIRYIQRRAIAPFARLDAQKREHRCAGCADRTGRGQAEWPDRRYVVRTT